MLRHWVKFVASIESVSMSEDVLTLRPRSLLTLPPILTQMSVEGKRLEVINKKNKRSFLFFFLPQPGFSSCGNNLIYLHSDGKMSKDISLRKTLSHSLSLIPSLSLSLSHSLSLSLTQKHTFSFLSLPWCAMFCILI